MQSENILCSSLNDLLFENRNKMYGAYVLRRDYPLQVRRALAAVLLLAGAFGWLSLLQTDRLPVFPVDTADGHQLADFRIAERVIPPPPAPKQAAAPAAKFVSGLVFTAETDSSDRLRDISRLAIGSVDIPPDSFAGEEPTRAPQVVQAPPTAPLPVVTASGPVTDPDVQPAFPGGPEQLVEFLRKHLRSPLPLEPGETVQVQVKFVVGYEGELQTFAVQKDGGKLFNDEVIRVLKRMPRWVPGRKGSHPVPAWFTLPVKFTGDE